MRQGYREETRENVDRSRAFSSHRDTSSRESSFPDFMRDFMRDARFGRHHFRHGHAPHATHGACEGNQTTSSTIPSASTPATTADGTAINGTVTATGPNAAKIAAAFNYAYANSATFQAAIDGDAANLGPASIVVTEYSGQTYDDGKGLKIDDGSSATLKEADGKQHIVINTDEVAYLNQTLPKSAAIPAGIDQGILSLAVHEGGHATGGLTPGIGASDDGALGAVGPNQNFVTAVRTELKLPVLSVDGTVVAGLYGSTLG